MGKGCLLFSSLPLTLSFITSLLDTINDKEKILKADREKRSHTYREGKKIRITADFLSETMEVKKTRREVDMRIFAGDR